jgi:hypothetical protein
MQYEPTKRKRRFKSVERYAGGTAQKDGAASANMLVLRGSATVGRKKALGEHAS